MTYTITAHFNGRFIVPDEPVQLPVGRRLRLWVELAERAEAPFADLLQFSANLPDAPSDLSVRHDHYLCEHPKK